MALKKITIKVINDKTDRFEWEHLAYTDEALYLGFLRATNSVTRDFNRWLSKWAKEDFNIDMSVAYKNDIFILKRLVKDRYKTAHPYLYIESFTDRQGWMRVWLTKKMKEELKIYGKRTEI